MWRQPQQVARLRQAQPRRAPELRERLAQEQGARYAERLSVARRARQQVLRLASPARLPLVLQTTLREWRPPWVAQL